MVLINLILILSFVTRVVSGHVKNNRKRIYYFIVINASSYLGASYDKMQSGHDGRSTLTGQK